MPKSKRIDFSATHEAPRMFLRTPDGRVATPCDVAAGATGVAGVSPTTEPGAYSSPCVTVNRVLPSWLEPLSDMMQRICVGRMIRIFPPVTNRTSEERRSYGFKR